MSISFSLSNFKGFKELQSVNLKPLTVICGTNNSGKSSLIQSLLLMKQSNPTKFSPNTYGQLPLTFNGSYVQLGSFLDVVYNHSSDEEIVLKWKIENEKIETRLHKYYSINSELTVKIKNIEFEKSLAQLEINNFLFKDLNSNFSLEFIRKNDGKYKIKLRNISIKDIIVQWIYRNYKYRDYRDNYISKIRELLKYLEDKSIKLFQEGIIEEECFDHAQVTFQSIFPTQILINNFPQQSSSILKRIREKLPSMVRGKVSGYLEKLIDMIVSHLESIITSINFDKQQPQKDKYLDIDLSISKEDEDLLNLSISKEVSISEYYFPYRATVVLLRKSWSGFRYIGPIREAPKRFYPFNDLRIIDIGINGENMPLVLAVEKETIIPKYYRCICQQKSIKKYELRDKDKLIDSVNWWLSDFMKLPRIHSVNELSGVINQVKVNSLGIKLDLTDVGFGVSQILPIIVECLRMAEGETIILEQPEIHLHPSLQSKLADFFVCMAKSGKNLVVETHSEHFIYRLCLRIAQEESNDTRNLINILFVSCDEENKSSIAKPIEVNKYGEIENWPVGFFDENDSRDLISATLKKRMSNL
jgi:predicted ATPase